jgi:hypothetical protein
MDWWLCPWRILETVTFSWNILYPKRNVFQPRIQYWHKTQCKFDGTPDTIYHLIISQWYLSQAFWEPDVQVCAIEIE